MDGVERCSTEHFVRVISDEMIANRIQQRWRWARNHCGKKNVVAQVTKEKIKGADETNGDHYGQKWEKGLPKANWWANVRKKVQWRELVALCVTEKITLTEDIRTTKLWCNDEMSAMVQQWRWAQQRKDEDERGSAKKKMSAAAWWRWWVQRRVNLCR